MVTVLPPLPFSGFEVYETEKVDPEEKEEEKKEKKEEGEEEEEVEEEVELSESEKELQRFVAMNGKILETAYFDNMYKNSFDEDYEGISNNGDASFQEVELSRFFKGKKICLKKANDTGAPLTWDKLESCL